MMTIKRYGFLALSALVLGGLLCCNKIEENDAPEAEPSYNGGTITLSCSIDPTKTVTSVVNHESITEWEEGDEISVTSGGVTYTYVAESSGPSTDFVPKVEGEGIPVSADGSYSITAVYGITAASYTVQNIASDGTNDVKKPLAASFEGQASTGKIPLLFEQQASLLELTFAAENLTFKSLLLSGMGGDDVTVNFTDGLDLSSGDASVQIVMAGINTGANNGLYMNATLSDDTHIGRVIWLGSAKSYPVGKHVVQPLSVWKTGGAGSGGGISTGKQLKEFQILTSKGCPVTRFTADGTPGGKVPLLADVDISGFSPWSPIGPNGNQDPSESLLQYNVLRNEFDGGGHTVSGLSLTRKHNNWYNYGLFGVAAADIHDLTVAGSIVVQSGSAQNLNLCVGGIVSTLCPGYSIQRCTSKVNIDVQYLGREALSSSDVLTATDATVHKWHRVGGVVGRCSGSVADCIFGPNDCATVKFTNGTSAKTVVVNCHYGGVIGHVCEYGSNNVTITGCSNEGTVQCAGKISGHVLRVSSETNPGNGAVHAVFHGMSLGGIAGTLGHMVSEEMPAQSGTVTMSNCHNHSYADQKNAAGGNFGGVVGRTGCDNNITITDCSNDGTIRGSKSSDESSATTNKDNFLTFGGVIGSCYATGGEISALTNKGRVYINGANCAGQLGGVIGVIGTFCGGVNFTDLRNEGEVYTSKTDADQTLNLGGIVGRLWMYRGATFVTLNNIVNTGYIHNASNGKNAIVGGLVGMSPGSFKIIGGINKGEVTAWTSSGSPNYCKVGGLVGEIWEQSASFENCKQYGNVLFNNTNSRHGFVVGYLDTNTGTVTATGCYAGGKFGIQGGTQTTITADNFSSVLPHESTSISPSTSTIPMACKNSNSTYLGSPWEWNYHAPEDVPAADAFTEEPDDSSADPSGTFNYAALATMGHPRILMNEEDLSTLKTKVTTNRGSNQTLAGIHDDVMILADRYVQEAMTSNITRTFDSSGRRILEQSRKALKRLFACSYAYRLTGGSLYLETVKRDLNTVCNFSDWNGSQHFLDAAEMAAGVAIAYDWCYNDLPYNTRVAAHSALVNFAINTTDSGHNYPAMTNNWNEVCYAGVVLAALAVYEKDKTVSANIIESCISHNPAALRNLYTNGGYPEGYSYWAYGTNFQVLMMAALSSVFGSDGGLFNTVSWDKTASWMLMMNGPSGKAFSYSDCSPVSNQPQYAMWYLAKKLSNNALLYNELQILDMYSSASDVRLLPMIPVIAADMSIPSSASAPSLSVWPTSTPTSSDVAPVVIVRSGWTGSSSDKYLAIKGGKPNSSHSHMDAGSFVFDAFGHRWSEDPGSPDYSKAEAAGITMSDCGKNSTRWDVFHCSNFSHSTVMGANCKFNPNGNATFTSSIINSSSEKGAVINMLPVLDSDDLELEGNALSSGSASRTVKMTSEGNIVIIDDIKVPGTLGGGSNTTFWWRMMTRATVNWQSGYIELSFGDITQKYRLTVSASGCSPALTVWPAQGPNGVQSYDTTLSSDYQLVGHSFTVNAGSKATVTTTLTLI